MHFLADVLQLSLQYRLNSGTDVLALAQGEQFFDLVQREAQFLCVFHEAKITNLFFTKQPISARASRCRWNQPPLLVEADGVDAQSSQLPGFAYMHCSFHEYQNKPWS